ncbi:MAG: serine/threonine-protein phosphatase [Sandaracinus sp.]|nr:serine/threonine-protein phosphatase [Sandaracinus sp.]
MSDRDGKNEEEREPVAPDADEGDVTATMPDMPAAKRRSLAPGEADDSESTEAKDAKDTEPSEERTEPESDETRPGKISTPPSGPISYRLFGIIDVGLVREHNEDNFMTIDLTDGTNTCWGGEDDPHSGEKLLQGEVRDKGLILAVCDGMGGAAAGEVASKMAVDTVREVMAAGSTPKDRDVFAHRLVYSIEEAGARIFGAAKMDRSRRGMGTTATVAGLLDRVLFVGQVGDSRCYVLRNGALTLVTKDQSLVNQLIEAGQLTEEEAESFEHSNIILQALGTTEEVSVDLTFLELRRGDRLLLCSDGLSGLVHQDMIREVLGDGDDLEAIARRLLEMANAGGGHDNITCVVADVDGEGLAPADDAPPARYQQYPLPAGGVRPSEIPPREPTMKTSSRKPGADVKREPIETDEGVATVPAGGFPWGIVIALLVIAAIVIGLVVSGGGEEPTAQPPPRPEPPAEPEPVEVCVRSDVPEGELFVDGQSYGPMREGVSLCVELLPGAYRFEARTGESVAARATATVREGVPADVELRLPEGAARPVDAGPEGAEPTEPDTTETATMASTDSELGASSTETGMAATMTATEEPAPTMAEATEPTAPTMSAGTMATTTMSTTTSTMTTTSSGTTSSGTTQSQPPANPF